MTIADATPEVLLVEQKIQMYTSREVMDVVCRQKHKIRQIWWRKRKDFTYIVIGVYLNRIFIALKTYI